MPPVLVLYLALVFVKLEGMVAGFRPNLVMKSVKELKSGELVLAKIQGKPALSIAVHRTANQELRRSMIILATAGKAQERPALWSLGNVDTVLTWGDEWHFHVEPNSSPSEVSADEMWLAGTVMIGPNGRFLRVSQGDINVDVELDAFEVGHPDAREDYGYTDTPISSWSIRLNGTAGEAPETIYSFPVI
jgi:hypothetical protein